MARSAEDLARLREYMLPEEFMRDLRRRVPLRDGEYGYFQAENIVCLEHFPPTTHRVRRLGGSVGYRSEEFDRC